MFEQPRTLPRPAGGVFHDRAVGGRCHRRGFAWFAPLCRSVRTRGGEPGATRANNLHQIGTAYSVFLDNHKSNPAAFVSDNNWPTLLLPLVENQESVFWCTDDTRNP